MSCTRRFAKGKYSLGWNSRWRNRRNYSMLRKDIQGSNTRSSKFGMIGKSGLSQVFPHFSKFFWDEINMWFPRFCGFQCGFCCLIVYLSVIYLFWCMWCRCSVIRVASWYVFGALVECKLYNDPCQRFWIETQFRLRNCYYTVFGINGMIALL